MTPPTPTDQPGPAEPGSFLAKLDAWMAANPWHPRAAPFFVYMIGLLVGALFIGGAFGVPELPILMPVIYGVQLALVVFLLWRYRQLTPELNIRFHWLAVPTGVGLLFAWVYLGYGTNWLSHQLQGVPVVGDAAGLLVPTDPDQPWSKTTDNAINSQRDAMGDAWFWTMMSMRFAGMSLIVPLFEELWVRSAVLRGVFDPRNTKTAILQLASDLPIVGEAISNTAAAKRANQQPPMFTQQLVETRVGQITFFSVVLSTIVFMLAHQRRDYAGCIACGVVWCWLVWYTNKPKRGETWADQPEGGRYGLGPIVWSHGITNAALWTWTLVTDDWQFL